MAVKQEDGSGTPLEDETMEIAERKLVLDEIVIILEPWVATPEALAEATEHTGLVTDLGLDSIGILELIMALERRFKVSVQNHELDMEVLSTMGNLITLIGKKMHENN
jgi:acyl carrier protein